MKKLILMAVAVAFSMACNAQTGEKYKEIAGIPSPEGKEIKLSEVVEANKYTLLDFWASWCPPCMAELPYLTEAYAEYKGKGFEIYGVSYDKDGDAWRNTIKDKNMNWVHVSSVTHWDSPTQELYNVRSIPANFLIAKDGTIVAKNLRGEALSKKLAELLD
ncbi:MAG: TlpA family protein disulfide reductase [Rikenellaceae bacterium]|jgi:thiol-disulfide isomerase/thioredoxin|nr:TlpA family protein disulfide reductase [Rikenellaceae bacterium]